MKIEIINRNFFIYRLTELNSDRDTVSCGTGLGLVQPELASTFAPTLISVVSLYYLASILSGGCLGKDSWEVSQKA